MEIPAPQAVRAPVAVAATADAAMAPGAQRASSAQGLQQDAAGAAADLAPARVLVIGDSTAAGTGAPPTMSVAARIARAFPGVQVDNLGVDGAVLADTLRQLESDAGPPPRLLLIMAGGNDVFRITTVDRMERALDALLAAASQRSDRVILLSPGNLASAPGLWWPFDRVRGCRSRAASDAFRRVAARHPVLHVSMYRERDEDPFAQEPARYFSDDGIHPSAEGYALWFDQLRAQAPLERWLEP